MKSGSNLRDEGIANALKNTDWQWRDQAFQYVALFAKEKKEFAVEQVRAYAVANGLSEPTSKRAWGGVIVRAKKLGIVEQIGHIQVKNPTAHKANAALWIGI